MPPSPLWKRPVRRTRNFGPHTDGLSTHSTRKDGLSNGLYATDLSIDSRTASQTDSQTPSRTDSRTASQKDSRTDSNRLYANGLSNGLYTNELSNGLSNGFYANG